ncbi:glutamate 5-kinase [Rhodoluna sp.]|uniref:glutamate 5-kinase n=1 Tax=Rhodoluna sp. TaxID=1969481 RepID=UPI0025F2E530|nr:glutamate 5-kinase [Rhodoluna sp.]
MTLRDRSELATAKRVVVKVGSSSISGANENKIDLLVDALAKSNARGTEVILVTSGAIANALPLFNLTARPDDLPMVQALASVGQSKLIARYQASLEKYSIIVGQVLLTSGDFEHDETRNNAKATLEQLVKLRTLPIVNENDTVATHEIKFGDNDRLAALVAVLVDADALILLSDVDGLYDMPPEKDGAKRIEIVSAGSDMSGIEIGGTGSKVGTGGAATKVSAAKLATDSGVAVLLTSTDLVSEALAGANIGTWFEPTNK